MWDPLKEAKESGRMEACEAMAKSMLQEAGYSKDMIIRITKLSKNRIDELKKEVMQAEA